MAPTPLETDQPPTALEPLFAKINTQGPTNERVVSGANTQNKAEHYVKGCKMRYKMVSEFLYIFVLGHLFLWKNVFKYTRPLVTAK